MSQLHKLVYTSKRHADCTDVTIQKILNQSRANNHAKDVTGILMHSQKYFIQYLEGEKDTIYELYENIGKDPRHSNVQLRYFSPTQERLFPSWQMGYKDIDGQSLNIQSNVSASDQKRFEDLLSNPDYSEKEGIGVLQLFFNIA